MLPQRIGNANKTMTTIERFIDYIGEENLKDYNFRYYINMANNELKKAYEDGQTNALNTWVLKTGNLMKPEEYVRQLSNV